MVIILSEIRAQLSSLESSYKKYPTNGPLTRCHFLKTLPDSFALTPLAKFSPPHSYFFRVCKFLTLILDKLLLLTKIVNFSFLELGPLFIDVGFLFYQVCYQVDSAKLGQTGQPVLLSSFLP